MIRSIAAGVALTVASTELIGCGTDPNTVDQATISAEAVADVEKAREIYDGTFQVYVRQLSRPCLVALIDVSVEDIRNDDARFVGATDTDEIDDTSAAGLIAAACGEISTTEERESLFHNFRHGAGQVLSTLFEAGAYNDGVISESEWNNFADIARERVIASYENRDYKIEG